MNVFFSTLIRAPSKHYWMVRGSVLLEGTGVCIIGGYGVCGMGVCIVGAGIYFPFQVTTPLNLHFPLLPAHLLLIVSSLQKASSVVCGEAASRRPPGRDLGERWALSVVIYVEKVGIVCSNLCGEGGHCLQ